MVAGASALGNGYDNSEVVDQSGRPYCEKARPAELLYTYLSSFAPWSEALGIRGNVVQVKAPAFTDYAVFVRFEFALPGLVSPHSLTTQFAFRKFPLYRSLSLFGGGGIAIGRIVPQQSEIMSACQKGDLFTVRELFRLGKARPDDVTKDNGTPLMVRPY
jgi:hypothetical protein